MSEERQPGPETQVHRHHLANHLGLAAWFAAMLAMALFAPDRFALAFQEDGWGEWATFFAFAIAAGLYLAAASRTRPRCAHVARAALVLFALGCLFVAGEEISWGQRLFGIVPDAFFLERNYQREINFHNFIEALGGRSAWLLASLAFGYGLCLPAIRKRLSRSIEARPWASSLPYFEYAGWFALVGVGALAHPFELADEALELLLGLLFVLEAHDRVLATREPGATRAMLRPGLIAGALAMLLGMATPPALDRWVHRADPTDVARARSELAALAFDLEARGSLNGIYFRSLDVIHKRIDAARAQNMLRLPPEGRFASLDWSDEVDDTSEDELGARRRRHALDPWGGAYWFAYNRELAGLLVYTMGPNGRRDTHLRSIARERDIAAALEGDDMGIWIDFSERLADTRD